MPLMFDPRQTRRLVHRQARRPSPLLPRRSKLSWAIFAVVFIAGLTMLASDRGTWRAVNLALDGVVAILVVAYITVAVRRWRRRRLR